MSSARAAIENTINKYGYLFDEGQAERIGECFTLDGKVGNGPGVVEGREAIAADYARKRAAPHYQNGGRPVHINTNIYILAEDESTATVNTNWTLYRIDPEGNAKFTLLGGYHDEFVKVGGEWLIKHRVSRSFSKL